MRFLNKTKRIIKPKTEPQIPLFVKYDTSPIWRDLKQIFGLSPTGAAIAVALFEVSHHGDGFVSYSRWRDYYAAKSRHPLLTYDKVIAAVAALEAQGLIIHEKQCPGGLGWQSAMRATQALCDTVGDLMHRRPRLPLELPRSPLVLRDADGIEIDLPHTRETSRMSKRVHALNEALKSVEVTDGEGRNLTAPVVRIFNADKRLRRGGRYYANGISWQNIKSADRRYLLMDGEPVAELDYAAQHPAMLYAEAGLQAPSDCYYIPPWPRKLVKRSFLTLINARNLRQAQMAIAHSPEMQAASESDENLMCKAGLLVDAIKDRHRPISTAFHSDAGARLMRKDSDLAEVVMRDMLKVGVCALPVHDSFVVPFSQEAKLRSVMHDAADRIGLGSIGVTANH